MSVPLIIKAAALGGAAYAASRWLTTQRRRQRLRNPYASASASTHATGYEPEWPPRAPISRESHPGENPVAPTVSVGPTS